MPISFACPGCAKKFKVPDEMTGRSTKCPQCGAGLVVPSPTAVASWQPQPVAAPPMTAPAPGQFEVANAAPGGRRLPQVSRRMLILGGAGLLGVVLLGTVVWGGYKLFLGGSGLGDEVYYLPNNCQLIVSLRPQQMVESAAWKDVRKEIVEGSKDPEKDLEQLTGFSISNVQQLVLGVAMGADSNNPDVVFVVKTVNPVTAEEMKSKKGGGSIQETKVGNYTIYESMPAAFCVVESKLVVVGKLDTLKKIFERNKAAELGDGLRAAIKNVDFSKSIAAALDMKESYAKLQDSSKKNGLDMDKVLEQAGITNPMGDIEGAAYEVDMGKDIKMKSVLLCKDSKTAEDMKKISDGMTTFLRRMFSQWGADTFDTWESSVSGSRMTGTMTLKTESIIKGINKVKDIGKRASGSFQKVGGLGPDGR